MPAVDTMSNAYATRNGFPPPRISRVSCQYTRQRQMEITCPLSGNNMTEVIQLEDTASRSSQCTLINYDYSQKDFSRQIENIMENIDGPKNELYSDEISDTNKIYLDSELNGYNDQYSSNYRRKICYNEPLTDTNSANHNFSGNGLTDKQLCEFTLNIPSVTLPEDLPHLKVTLKHTNENVENLKCFCTPQNKLGVLLYAGRSGEYKIDVTKNNRLVQGSPFSVFIEEDVLMKSPCNDKDCAIVGNPCTINFEIPTVNITENINDIKAILLTPHGERVELECTCAQRNTLNMVVTPMETGKHIISLLKSGRHVSGSPFPLMVEEGNEIKGSDNIETKQSSPNRTYEVCLDIPDIDVKRDLTRLKATLTRNGCDESEPLDCSCGPNKTLQLNFETRNTVHVTIDVTKDGRPVKGSPFQITIDNDNDLVPKSNKATQKLESTPFLLNNECDPSITTNQKTDHEDDSFHATLTKNSTGETIDIIAENSADSAGPTFTLPLAIESGHYHLDTTNNEVTLAGSPFLILVEDKENNELSISESNLDDYVNISVQEKICDTKSHLIEGTLTWCSDGKRENAVKCTFPCNDNFSISYNPNDLTNHVFQVVNKGCTKRNVDLNKKEDSDCENEIPFQNGVSLFGNGTDSSNTPKNTLPNSNFYYIQIDIPNTKFPFDLSIMEQDLYKHLGESVHTTQSSYAMLNLVLECSGDFRFYISMDGKPVKGSPFNVIVGEL